MSRSSPAGEPPTAPPLCVGAGRAVVTGGAGFIGSHLVEHLLDEGFAVVVVDDLSTGCLDNLRSVRDHDRLEVVVASVGDERVARAAFAEADVVFHLAGAVGVQRLARAPLEVMQANLRASEVALEVAADLRVPVLFTSSSEVYGEGAVPFFEHAAVMPGATEGLRGGYACAKAMSEWLACAQAQRAGLPVVVARLFNTVGPRQRGDYGMVLPRLVRQALQGEPLTVYGSGQQTRCFAHVHDVARALADLARSRSLPGRVVNVGSAVETPVAELAALVVAVTGSRAPIQRVPYEQVFPEGFADPPRRVPALDRLFAANGWVPTAPLRAVVEDVVAYERAATGSPGAVIPAASPAS